jgi:hypothetical protein
LEVGRLADWLEDLFRGYSEEIAETTAVVAQDWIEALFGKSKEEAKKK